jgi:hypothetical protein
MSPWTMGCLVLACTFGGALLGMWLRRLVPDGHVSDAAWDTAKLGIGLVATMTALLLGLVTASAKSSFDEMGNTIRHTAAELLTLDRSLGKYGPETKEIREAVKLGVARRIEETWPQDGADLELAMAEDTPMIEAIGDRIRALSPESEVQRDLRARALGLIDRILESRWLVLSGRRSSIPVLFLTALTAWLTVTFTIFGVFAPRNSTVVTILFVCALSVASAVFLILEMDGPFEGVLRVSPDPLLFALSRLGQ